MRVLQVWRTQSHKVITTLMYTSGHSADLTLWTVVFSTCWVVNLKNGWQKLLRLAASCDRKTIQISWNSRGNMEQNTKQNEVQFTMNAQVSVIYAHFILYNLHMNEQNWPVKLSVPARCGLVPTNPRKDTWIELTPSFPTFAVVKSNTCVVILYVCAS